MIVIMINVIVNAIPNPDKMCLIIIPYLVFDVYLSSVFLNQRNTTKKTTMQKIASNTIIVLPLMISD